MRRSPGHPGPANAERSRGRTLIRIANPAGRSPAAWLAAISLVFAAALAAPALGAQDAEQASAASYAIRIVVPATDAAPASDVVMPGEAGAADAFSYPDGGDEVATGALASQATTSGDADLPAASASSSVEELSILGGQIRARAVHVVANAPGPDGSATELGGTAVEGLHVLGRPVDASAPTRVPLADWGYVDVLEQFSSVDGVAADDSVVALDVHLTADHGGLPAGTEILVGYAQARAVPASDGGSDQAGGGSGQGGGGSDQGSGGTDQGGGSDQGGGGSDQGSGGSEQGGGGTSQGGAPPPTPRRQHRRHAAHPPVPKSPARHPQKPVSRPTSAARRAAGITDAGNLPDMAPRGLGRSVRSRVVRAAVAQIGWPYVWGGESRSEGGFDCSGLVDYAFAAAGHALPGRPTAAVLWQMAAPVERSQLEPGDLAFLGTGSGEPFHVALYVGNGFVVVASHRGEPIGYQPLDAVGWDGFGRLWSPAQRGFVVSVAHANAAPLRAAALRRERAADRVAATRVRRHPARILRSAIPAGGFDRPAGVTRASLVANRVPEGLAADEDVEAALLLAAMAGFTLVAAAERRRRVRPQDYRSSAEFRERTDGWLL